MALTDVAPVLTYESKLAELRTRLNGRTYCAGVQELLPDMTKAQIRNLANGRGENTLFLAALEIVIHKMDTRQKNDEERLREVAQSMGLAA